MSIDIIQNLFIALSFAIMLFLSSSLFYTVRSNYASVDGTIEQSTCILFSNSKLYSCDLTVNYFVNGNKITNRLVINSEKMYKQGDSISIEYDVNNYLNISVKTEYKQIALSSSVCGIILLITSIIIYDKIEKSIMQKINNILSYVSFFS